MFALPQISLTNSEVLIYRVLHLANLHSKYVYKKAEEIDAVRNFVLSILSPYAPEVSVHAFILYISATSKTIRIYYNRKFINISPANLKLDVFPRSVREIIKYTLKMEGAIHGNL